MSKIFISHSSVDNAVALALAQWLKDNGWGDYFLDSIPESGIVPGERWQEKLRTAADRCEAMLFLISPAWCNSPWCIAEFLQANTGGKAIIGVLVEATPVETLPKEMTAKWQLCDLVTGTERQSYGEVWFAKAGLSQLKLGLQKCVLDPSTFLWPPQHDPDRAPYPGLKALEAEDAAIFFGREAEITRGLDALRGIRERGVDHMFVILGASGAGKSSFLRAGLWPRLKREDRHFLPIPVIRPERTPISGDTGLAASLVAAFHENKTPKNRADIENVLKNPHGLNDLLGQLQALAHKTLESEAEPPTIIIPIDQGEELFGAEGRTEADTFLSLLGQTLVPPGSDDVEAITPRRRAVVIVAIRSDSYEWLQTETRLEPIKQALFNLPPLAREEFKTVIEGPARRSTDGGRKLTVEPALTEQLLKDAEGADALPLLAFTLERLFVKYGGDGDLRLDEYKELGGVRGSIEAAVMKAFAEPERRPAIPSEEVEQDRLLRKALPWLAGIDPETEKPKRWVARWNEIPADAEPLLKRLVEARLLISDQPWVEGKPNPHATVEVAHEALFRQWPKVVTWLKEEAEALMAAEAVKRAAGEWAKKGGGSDWLTHSGERLSAAENLQQRPDFPKLLEEGRTISQPVGLKKKRPRLSVKLNSIVLLSNKRE